MNVIVRIRGASLDAMRLCTRDRLVTHNCWPVDADCEVASRGVGEQVERWLLDANLVAKPGSRRIEHPSHRHGGFRHIRPWRSRASFGKALNSGNRTNAGRRTSACLPPHLAEETPAFSGQRAPLARSRTCLTPHTPAARAIRASAAPLLRPSARRPSGAPASRPSPPDSAASSIRLVCAAKVGEVRQPDGEAARAAAAPDVGARGRGRALAGRPGAVDGGDRAACADERAVGEGGRGVDRQAALRNGHASPQTLSHLEVMELCRRTLAGRGARTNFRDVGCTWSASGHKRSKSPQVESVCQRRSEFACCCPKPIWATSANLGRVWPVLGKSLGGGELDGTDVVGISRQSLGPLLGPETWGAIPTGLPRHSPKLAPEMGQSWGRCVSADVGGHPQFQLWGSRYVGESSL